MLNHGIKSRLLLALIALLAVAMVLAACGSKEEKEKANNGQSEGATESRETLKVGVTAGVHEQILEKVKEVAAKDGLDLELTVFTDFIIPNVSLSEGELDVNSYQHRPFLESYKSERGITDLVDVAETVLNPMGMYSKKIASVDEIKEGDQIGLPSDPTNSARALLMFQTAGLITLTEGVSEEATVRDIVENPLNLKFMELDSAQLPKLLDELAAAAINTSFATKEGLTLEDDAIFTETHTSPWVNVMVTTEANKDSAAIEKLVKAYRSDETKAFIEETFKGAVLPLW